VFRAHVKQLQNTSLASKLLSDLATMLTVHLLDYVAGNIRSLVNAIEKVGFEVQWVKTPEDVANVEVC
jgi:hypothetical protein